MKKTYFNVKAFLYNISCVEYEPDNKEAGYAVVCLHGFGGDKESSAIERLAEDITSRGGAVIAFDFAAHGNSEACDEMLTVDNCVEDTKLVYEYAENKYKKVDFFATSFGAFVLINAMKYGCFKDSKLVLRAPAVKMENTFLNPICNMSAKELEKADKTECGFQRKMNLGYDFWIDLKSHSVSDILFENKTLLIYGDRDDVVCPDDMRTFASIRSNIEVKVVKGADHRFKGRGQLEEAILAAVDFLME